MDEHTIELIKNVTDWKAGDKIFIASTDFDYKQAETFTIVRVNGTFVTFTGKVNYDHFGEIYEGVDMRAEVGLLSRRIKIRGEVQIKIKSYIKISCRYKAYFLDM